MPDSYELFNTTTEAIGEYVATEYDYAGDYRRGLPDLVMPVIAAPNNPDPADVVAVELWKMDLKEHRERLRRRQALNQRVFGLILGQCSRTVRDRIQAAASWNTVNASSDPMRLLSLIRQSLFTGATTPKDVVGSTRSSEKSVRRPVRHPGDFDQRRSYADVVQHGARAQDSQPVVTSTVLLVVLQLFRSSFQSLTDTILTGLGLVGGQQYLPAYSYSVVINSPIASVVAENNS